MNDEAREQIKMQTTFADIIVWSFSENEIDCLEDFAEWHWEQIEKGREVGNFGGLIIELIAEREAEED